MGTHRLAHAGVDGGVAEWGATAAACAVGQADLQLSIVANGPLVQAAFGSQAAPELPAAQSKTCCLHEGVYCQCRALCTDPAHAGVDGGVAEWGATAAARVVRQAHLQLSNRAAE